MRRQEWGMRILFLELGVGYCFSFHIKLLQTWWLNPTQIYSLSSRRQKSEIKMSTGSGSLWRIVETICSLPFLASGDSSCSLWLYLSNLCLYLHVVFSPVASSLLSLVRTLVIGFRDHPGWSHLKSLNLISKTLFQIRSHSQVQEDISSQEPSFNHYSYLGVKFYPVMHTCTFLIVCYIPTWRQLLKTAYNFSEIHLLFTMRRLAHI